ncbi:hypothetical protein HN51_000373 [Arachis hypogaea]
MNGIESSRLQRERNEGSGRNCRGDSTQERGFSNKIAPKCNCQLYATIYKSVTVENPDRLFLGYSNYRDNLPYCKFFRWLDDVAGDVELEFLQKYHELSLLVVVLLLKGAYYGLEVRLET